MRQAPPSIVSLLLSDSQLARLAAKGDEQAVEAIFRRHQPDLYRFCLAMTGDPQLAQEATQGTLARVRRGLPDKDRGTKLKPWLYRIARDEVAAVQPEGEPRTEADTEGARRQARHLLADLERLPQRQRAVLVMRELSGLDFGQIGSAFETSPSAARETLYEARLRLQQVERDREADCAETMRRLSDSDGRAPWRLGLQLHLRGCPDCRAFRDEIASRRGGLALLAPLPVAVGGSALFHATATATAAVVVVAGISVADRGAPVQPERGPDAASAPGTPTFATDTPAGPAPVREPTATNAAAPAAGAGEIPGAAIDGRIARSTLAAVTLGNPPAAAEAPPPHSAASPEDAESEWPAIATHSPSSSPSPAPVVPASGPGSEDEEALPPPSPTGFEPEAEVADVADVVLDTPQEPPAEDAPEDDAVPLPAPPVAEVEPPSRKPDRSHHRDRPWRKRR